MSNQSDTRTSAHDANGWIFRQKMPDSLLFGSGPYPLILMLHGWTGDENSMWIFADRLPQGALLIAPRGRYATPHGGFGWHEHKMHWPGVDDFRPVAQALMKWISPENFYGWDRKPLMLLGFSQGAALAFTLALMYPERVAAVAGLSGFLPEGVIELLEGKPLENKFIFLAHGSKDELVEVGRARLAAEWLSQAGAQVDYCEDNVGHKLSASCFRSLQVFFQDVVR